MFGDAGMRMLVFRLGAERFALPLAVVSEVVEMPDIQTLPDSSDRVLGVATLRGELVSVYDPRPLLNAAADTYEMALLFTVDERRVGLAIDDVFDPIAVQPDELRPAPGVGSADGLLLGVVRRGSELIGVLDGDQLRRMLRVGDAKNDGVNE